MSHARKVRRAMEAASKAAVRKERPPVVGAMTTPFSDEMKALARERDNFAHVDVFFLLMNAIVRGSSRAFMDALKQKKVPPPAFYLPVGTINDPAWMMSTNSNIFELNRAIAESRKAGYPGHVLVVQRDAPPVIGDVGTGVAVMLRHNDLQGIHMAFVSANGLEGWFRGVPSADGREIIFQRHEAAPLMVTSNLPGEAT